MAVTLNHTIVYVRDKRASAAFYTEILGLPAATMYGPFAVVTVANDVSLDLLDGEGEPHPQHYAFLVGDEEFDQILDRIKERGLSHWADPGLNRPRAINHNDGGKGVYWKDPDGHLLEIITRPYGSGG
jgi:catechol 2,3-dioxygenase-like lactoylglutathione lyase family enzyme